jgi:hypothetical protein
MTYEIEIKGRGEDFLYRRDGLEVALDRTYCDGHRLFCDCTSGKRGFPHLPISIRQQIILDLCDYFDSLSNPLIYVIDELDPNRIELEQLFDTLITKGHKISVEYDSEEKREKSRDEMYLGILRAGKELKINETEIHSEADYWRWKGHA